MNCLRQAFRSLRHDPGFATVIVLTLALGIGANTAIFSFFRGILLGPLPQRDAERVVVFKKSAQDYGDPVGTEVGFLAADFRELQPQVHSLQSLSTYTLDSATVTGRGSATLVSAAVVSPNFFTVLGSEAAVGRIFSAHDKNRAHGRLATISYRYWKDRLGGDPAIIGRSINVNRVPFTVVGVMPPDFAFPREAQFWVTPAADIPEHAIGQAPLDFSGRGNYLRTIVGRLAPGVSREQAELELAPLVERLPNPNRIPRSVHLVNLRDHSVGDIRPALVVLLGCVGLVLFIACLNVANLMLARATRREREVAIRLALGAGRLRIAGQLVVESLLLALTGGVLGVLLSLWVLELLLHLAPDDIPRLASIQVDGAVLGFALAISLVTGLASGLAPIIGTARADLVSAFKSGDRAGSTGAGPRRLRSILVAGEVAISLILLVAAGLLVRSLARMEAVSWGVRADRVVSARVSFLDKRYASPAASVTFFKTLRESLSSAPGVESFGTTLDRIGVSWIHLPLTAEGQTYPTPADRPQANYHIISPGYLQTLGIAVQQGRDFNDHDDADAPRVVLVDASLARRYYPDGQAAGKTVKVVLPGGETVVQIAGVVRPVKSDGPVNENRPDIYFCYLQYPQNNFYVHLRTSLGLAAAESLLRQSVSAPDVDVPIADFASIDQVMARPSAARRFPLGLLGGFAVLALALAVVGIYAVTGYAVAQRTREIGVRMALGAQRSSVVRLMLYQGFHPIAAGLGLGLVGAALTAFAMRRLLFDVAPLDLPTFIAVPILLGIIAGLACLLPARRATKVDPMIVLRAE
jgi:putative ABC transport system permease protein